MTELNSERVRQDALETLEEWLETSWDDDGELQYRVRCYERTDQSRIVTYGDYYATVGVYRVTVVVEDVTDE